MRIGQSKHNSLLTKYSLQYEKKPRSRVFAPLAESYRKIGMLEEALKILKKGIRIHPNYTLGHIVLAHCYYDKEQFEAAYSTLLPYVNDNLENIRLQRLFAQVCEKLGNFDEALSAYKILLLINPKDTEIAKKVKYLEDDLIIPEEIKEELNNEQLFDSDEDDWVQVDFNHSELKVDKEQSYDQWSVVNQNIAAEIENPGSDIKGSTSSIDEWNVTTHNTPEETEEFDIDSEQEITSTLKVEDSVPLNQKFSLDKYKKEIASSKFEVEEHHLDDEFFLETYDNHSEETIDPVTDKITEEYDNKPIITHTLVDLYCEQGHFDKAISILDSILELHPGDSATKLKLKEVSALMSGELVELEIVNELDLTESIDQEDQNSIIEDNSKQIQLEKKLQLFLSEIKQVASLK